MTSEQGSATPTTWVRDAEAERRAGRAAAARRLAEAGLVDEPSDVAGRLVLALACLDLGDVAGARAALESGVPAVSAVAPEPISLDEGAADEPFPVQSDPMADLAENELENAFSGAEAEAVETWTTNRVAEAALRAVEAGRPEGVTLAEPGSPFATETVATLLERQGDTERARSIRRGLGHADAQLPEQRRHWIGTLERWLDNLRRASR